MSLKVVMLFNGSVLLFATAVGILYPQVGSILGYIGAFCGLFLIYIIPISVYLKRYKLNLAHPEIVRALEDNRIESVVPSSSSAQNDITSPKFVILKTPKNQRRRRGPSGELTDDPGINTRNTGASSMDLNKSPLLASPSPSLTVPPADKRA